MEVRGVKKNIFHYWIGLWAIFCAALIALEFAV
jgi:hypothetical protein